jgi:two-component system response regulator RegA
MATRRGARGADKSLLIVDDDRPFSTRLARAMESRGYQVRVAESVADGLAAIESEAPPSR